jgi:hypothetical protein
VPGEALSQCAHLAFAQPRARGLRVSDAFTVPMCPSHHAAFDGSGSQHSWWRARGIDPFAIADRLWRASIEAGRVKAERAAA